MDKLKFEGDLMSIDPSRLINKDENDKTANFFLVLSIVFNDFKGIAFLEKLVFDIYEKPNNQDISFHSGMYGGILTQTRKIFISNLQEFLKFIEENKEVIETVEFKNILTKLNNKDLEKRWSSIVDIALNKESKDISEFTNYLIKVRNNIGFHYNQSGKELRKAFCNYFYNKEKIKQNELAYFSLDENINNVRFFYGDGVIFEYLRSTEGDINEGFDFKYTKEISIVINDIIYTIFRLLKAYLKNRPK